MGISKRELLGDYYPDELPAIWTAWARLHGVQQEEPEHVSVTEFLSM